MPRPSRRVAMEVFEKQTTNGKLVLKIYIKIFYLNRKQTISIW